MKAFKLENFEKNVASQLKLEILFFLYQAKKKQCIKKKTINGLCFITFFLTTLKKQNKKKAYREPRPSVKKIYLQLEFKVIPDSFQQSNIYHHKNIKKKKLSYVLNFMLETVNKKENGCQLFTTTTTMHIIFFIKYNNFENSSLAFQICKAII